LYSEYSVASIASEEEHQENDEMSEAVDNHGNYVVAGKRTLPMKRDFELEFVNSFLSGVETSTGPFTRSKRLDTSQVHFTRRKKQAAILSSIVVGRKLGK
jgi:hypothetical protein